MSAIEKKTTQTIQRLFNFLVPPGMSAKERDALARAANISPETLRTAVKRQSMNVDTLVRLLLARGVSSKTIEHLPQTEFEKLSDGEIEWLEFGRQLSDAERKEFVSLVRFIRAKWRLDK